MELKSLLSVCHFHGFSVNDHKKNDGQLSPSSYYFVHQLCPNFQHINLGSVTEQGHISTQSLVVSGGFLLWTDPDFLSLTLADFSKQFYVTG